MARDETFRANVEANVRGVDEAAGDVERLEDAVERVDGKTAEVEADADTGTAESDIEAVEDAVERVDGSEARVGASADTGTAEADVREVGDAVEAVDGRTASVSADVSGAAQAESDIREVGDAAQAVSGTDADVSVSATGAGTAESDLREVQERAETLDKTEADVEITATGIEGLLRSVGDLDLSLGGVTSSLKGMGKGGLVAGGVTALAGGLAAAASSAADMAIEAKTTAELTGDSTEYASRLQTVWKSTGADVNDLNDVVLQTNGVLMDDAELAKQLGINMNDGKGAAEHFVQAVEALNGYTGDASDKADIMARTFGEEGVRQVGAMTSMIGGDLSGAIENVPEVNAITDEEAERAIEFKQTMYELTMQIGALVQAAGPLLTIMTDVVGGLSKMVSRLGQTDKEFAAEVESLVALKEAYDNFDKTLVQTAIDTAKSAIAQQEATKVAEDFADKSYEAFQKIGEQQQVAEDFGNKTLEAFNKVAEGANAYDEAINSIDWATIDTGAEAGATAMTAFNDTLFNGDNQAQELAAAQRDLATAMKESEGSFDATKEKGGAAQDALENLGRVLEDDLAKAYEESGGDMDAFMERAKLIGTNGLKPMEKAAKEAGVPIKTLREELGLTAKDYKARFELAGQQEAMQKIGLLQTSIDNLPKNVQARVTQKIIEGDYKAALRIVQGYYDKNPPKAETKLDNKDAEKSANKFAKEKKKGPTYDTKVDNKGAGKDVKDFEKQGRHVKYQDTSVNNKGARDDARDFTREDRSAPYQNTSINNSGAREDARRYRDEDRYAPYQNTSMDNRGARDDARDFAQEERYASIQNTGANMSGAREDTRDFAREERYASIQETGANTSGAREDTRDFAREERYASIQETGANTSGARSDIRDVEQGDYDATVGVGADADAFNGTMYDIEHGTYGATVSVTANVTRNVTEAVSNALNPFRSTAPLPPTPEAQTMALGAPGPRARSLIGPVAAPPVVHREATVNVNVSAAVIGSQLEVTRAVSDATRRAIRLEGRRQYLREGAER